MKIQNKMLFREIGYWSSMGAAVLGLINCIIFLVKGIIVYKTELEGKLNNLVSYFAQKCPNSVLYKISLGVLGVSVLAMTLSFFINAKFALKIIMAVARSAQIVSAAGMFIFRNSPLVYAFLIALAVMEIAVLVLYLVERDHRKTFLRVLVFFIATTGSHIIFLLTAVLLFLGVVLLIVSLISSLFQEPEHKISVVDIHGNVIGWLKRN